MLVEGFLNFQNFKSNFFGTKKVTFRGALRAFASAPHSGPVFGVFLVWLVLPDHEAALRRLFEVLHGRGLVGHERSSCAPSFLARLVAAF